MTEAESDVAAMPAARPLGSSEHSWARAAPGGTGITVLALPLSSPTPSHSLLQSALRHLQSLHPILASSLSPTSLLLLPTPTSPSLHLHSIPLSSPSSPFARTTTTTTTTASAALTPLHLVLEHELNQDSWAGDSDDPKPAFFASMYEAPASEGVLALRLHTAVCDRTSAAAMLKELLTLVRGEAAPPADWGEVGGGIPMPLESLIPPGRGDKSFWAKGLDLIGYSLNSFRLSNIAFSDAAASRSSQVVRLRLSVEETRRVLEGCKRRGIKLCSMLTAAGLMAARSSKGYDDDRTETYSVVTLLDCRKLLDPVLHDHHLGFYHSAIISTQWIGSYESVWEVAMRCHTAVSDAIKWDKHFKDLGELNFLMLKAMDNPSLTPSSSLRTSFMAVFEEPAVEDELAESLKALGLVDYMSCSSVHGVGPSIAVFDTIRGGALDCTCVYPSPLHTREQVQGLIDEMKRTLVEADD